MHDGAQVGKGVAPVAGVLGDELLTQALVARLGRFPLLDSRSGGSADFGRPSSPQGASPGPAPSGGEASRQGGTNPRGTSDLDEDFDDDIPF